MSIIYDALTKVEKTEETPMSTLAATPALSVAGKATSKPYIGAAARAMRATPPRLSAKLILAAALLGSLILYLMIVYSKIPAPGPAALLKSRQPRPFSAPVQSLPVDAAQALANMVRPVLYDTTTAVTPAYILQGIIYDDQNSLALINGKKVGLGDAIAGARVVAISIDGVELATGNDTFFLPLE